MPYGHSLTVRSHRRGGTRRRPSIVPVIVIGSVVVLVAAGLVAGYLYLIGSSCSGQVTATVVVSPRIETMMQGLRRSWADSSPSVDGTCAMVSIEAMDSAAATTALSGRWNAKTDGPTPDAWVPDSTAWAKVAGADEDAAAMLPSRQPSLARSPLVLAVPKPMAEAAGILDTPVTWSALVKKLSGTRGWAQYGHASWGEFRIGLSDPQTSTAGLLAVLAVADANHNGVLDAGERPEATEFERSATVRVGTSAEIFNGLTSVATQGVAATLAYVSAFPALEQDVVSYNLTKPEVPLVAVNPQENESVADFPYLVLDASWSASDRQQVVSLFLEYLRGKAGRAAFVDGGYREAE